MSWRSIVFNRGDSYDLEIQIVSYWDNSEIYYLQGDDTVYLGVMDPHQPFEEALIKKVYTKEDFDLESKLVIRFEPEDTLDLIPGKYYYAIKLHMDHDEVDLFGNVTHIDEVKTVVNKTKFVICD